MPSRRLAPWSSLSSPQCVASPPSCSPGCRCGGRSGRPARRRLGLGDLLSPLKRLSCRIADEGCSPGDQVADIGGQLDLIVSLAGILFYIGAAFFLSAAMARVPGWHDLAGRARWFGIAFIVLLVASVVIGGLGVFGLMNRLLAITGAAGLAVLAWRIALPVPRSYGPENAARR